LLCFWKHTTRREALKFFLEQVQGFIYEIPRGVGETEVWT
jgi:hypothetical protein